MTASASSGFKKYFLPTGSDGISPLLHSRRTVAVGSPRLFAYSLAYILPHPYNLCYTEIRENFHGRRLDSRQDGAFFCAAEADIFNPLADKFAAASI